MRIAVFSDIHGNDIALQASLLDIQTKGALDALWILGDLAAFGPAPVRSLDRLYHLSNTVIIAGNTDRFLFTGAQPAPTPLQAMQSQKLMDIYTEVTRSCAWTQGALAISGWLPWLEALPKNKRVTLPDGTRVLLEHASPGHDDGPALYPDLSTQQLRDVFIGHEADLIFVGHTHQVADVCIDGVHIVNTGSISNPFPPDLRATWVCLDCNTDGYSVTFHKVDYDHHAVMTELEKLRHPGRRFIIDMLRGRIEPSRVSDMVKFDKSVDSGSGGYMASLYPLRFKEILRNYGFGNRWIVQTYEKVGLPENHRIAETWEVVDRKGESSVLLNGPLAGRTLHELIDAYGSQLLGRDILKRFGTRFPLLIKFLDASNVLGEQAHHNDALAAQQGLDDPGKTEGWYMLRTKPDASIHCGHKPNVTSHDVSKALLAGNIVTLMQEYPVQPGDAFLLHAGTMHYSKGGVLFYEIMQNSDVYIGLKGIDPNLSEKEKEQKLASLLQGVHLEHGFDPKINPVTISKGINRRTFVFVCQYFALERLDVNETYQINCDGERFYVLSQIQGTSRIVCDTYTEVLKPGQTCLLPASLGVVDIIPDEKSSLLKAYVPDFLNNVINPCRDAGISDDDIYALGGHTRLNTLSEFFYKYDR